MLLMIDNYDSFTYNLVQYFGELDRPEIVGAETGVNAAPLDARPPTVTTMLPAVALGTVLAWLTGLAPGPSPGAAGLHLPVPVIGTFWAYAGDGKAALKSVLAGERPDRVPFIIWNNKLPSPEIERRLLELGACIIVKSTVWHSHLEGIDVRRERLHLYHRPRRRLTPLRRLPQLQPRLRQLPPSTPT